MSKEYWKPGNMLYPVPAVMVSCGREGETPNIITVAWAGTICSDPARYLFLCAKSVFHTASSGIQEIRHQSGE